MKTPLELRKKAGELKAQASAIYEGARARPDGMTDEETRQFDTLMSEVESLLSSAAAEEARVSRLNAAEEAFRSRTPADEARDRTRPEATRDVLPHNDRRNTRSGYHGYSILKVLRQQLDAQRGRGHVDGLEAEVHQELVRYRMAMGINASPQGVLVPWDLPVDLRAANDFRDRHLPTPTDRGPAEFRTGVLDTTAGAGAIPTYLSTDLISILRARLAVVSLGATVMPDMQGLFAIPRQSGAATGAWVAQGSAPSASNQTIDQVAFSPKTAAAFTDYTRRFLEQTSVAPEQFIRADLMAVLARVVETAAINGTGASNDPTGLLQNSNVPTIALGTNGLALANGDIINMETIVSNANADMGSLGYLTNSKVRGKLKNTAKIGSTFPIFVWENTPTPLNGYPAAVSNLVPSNLTKGTSTGVCSAIIFGNWNDLVIVFWSGIDLLVDPYTGSSSGTVRVVAFQDADVQPRHPESFDKIVDALTT